MGAGKKVRMQYRCMRFTTYFLKKFFKADFNDNSSIQPQIPKDVLDEIKNKARRRAIDICKEDHRIREGIW